MARAIDSEVAFRFLTEQIVKETRAFSKGVNKGLNISRSAIRNPDAIPTLTPQNEWVSVEDEIPSDDDDGLEFFCMTNATGKCGGVLPLEWEVATVRGKTVRRWKWRSRISPWAVTHWMKRPAPPGENNNVPTKAPNEPLTLERLREMDGDPVWIVDVGPHKWYGPGWAIVDRDNCLVRTVKNWNPVFFEKYGERWLAYRRPKEGET